MPEGCGAQLQRSQRRVVLGHGQRDIAILDGNLQVTGLLRLDDEIRSQLGDFIRERTA
jgi:hypothetical protein